jgi:transcriptional regulator with XRE-family HTH domain
MRLVEWRRQEGLTQQELADALGCTQSFVSNMERANDPQKPRDDAMVVRIYRVTKGQVAPNDFYDLPDLSVPELQLGASEPLPLFAASERDLETVELDQAA